MLKGRSPTVGQFTLLISIKTWKAAHWSGITRHSPTMQVNIVESHLSKQHKQKIFVPYTQAGKAILFIFPTSKVLLYEIPNTFQRETIKS